MARFYGKNEIDAERARKRLDWLIEKKKEFILTEKRKPASGRQNRYLHVLFSFAGLHIGLTKEYTKQQLFKQHLCPEFFEVEIDGRKYYRSITDPIFTTKYMAEAITTFINRFYQETGHQLPFPDQEDFINECERHVERFGNKVWT